MRGSRHILVSALVLVCGLILAPVAQAASVPPMLFLNFGQFKFKAPKGTKPGVLSFKSGKVIAVRYTDGSVTTTNTPFETIVNARVDISRLTQDDEDPFSFLNGTVKIRQGSKVYIDGALTNITFDPGTNTTDGIVTLNLGFALDNYFFTLFNQSLNSQFMSEYAANSSTTAGALALTLNGPVDPTKLIDGFDVNVTGNAAGQFQIPEPGSIFLMGAGLAALAGLFRKTR
jgi:hypothetical protein